jgi:hypothetical protein
VPAVVEKIFERVVELMPFRQCVGLAHKVGSVGPDYPVEVPLGD